MGLLVPRLFLMLLLRWLIIIGAAFYCAITQPFAPSDNLSPSAPASVIFSFFFFIWAFWMIARALIGWSRVNAPSQSSRGSRRIDGAGNSRDASVDQFTREALRVGRPPQE